MKDRIAFWWFDRTDCKKKLCFYFGYEDGDALIGDKELYCGSKVEIYVELYIRKGFVFKRDIYLTSFIFNGEKILLNPEKFIGYKFNNHSLEIYLKR